MSASASLPRQADSFVRPNKRRDYEFLAPALEVLETPPSPVKTALILTICAFVAASLIWTYFGRLDIIAVAQGKVQPVGRTKIVQPLIIGKVVTRNTVR
jgi:hemolysin D